MKNYLQRFILMMLMAVVIGVSFAFTFDWLQAKPEPVQLNDTTPATLEATNAPAEATKPPVVISPTLSEEEASVVSIVENLKYSIVSINTYNSAQGFDQLMGSGSGVGISEDEQHYYIMTNDHVVAGGNRHLVVLYEGEQIEATVVGHDKDTEIAVLSIPKDQVGSGKLKLAQLGKSAELVVGENVLAIGNALGYGQTVTRGIISAIDRELSGYRGGYAYKMIQTDAAINPGNSGGALVNMKGEVVGINTIKIVDARVEGVGFAIPIEPAREISAKLMELGYLPKTFLGVTTRYVHPSTLKLNNLPLGAVVVNVASGSPADQAGVQPNDIIVQLGDTATPDPESLSFAVRSHQPGDQLSLTVFRNGDNVELQVTLSNTTE